MLTAEARRRGDAEEEKRAGHESTRMNTNQNENGRQGETIAVYSTNDVEPALISRFFA
jgi:hypothetical protein